MNFLRLLIVPLAAVAVALILTIASLYTVPVVSAQQKERSAHSRKTTEFHYVCPMHEDITSKSRGICRKCKMKLVRKPIVKQPSTGSN